jgi:hypothetical protein
VAVRTPHLALVDLAADTVETGLLADEFRHVLRLHPDVIEVEHARVRFSAVDTLALRQDRPHEGGVAPPQWWRWPLDASPFERAPPMAAHADDLTERDLTIDPVELGAVVSERADPGVLRFEMVEFEHHGVPLATVGAWVQPQVLEDVGLRSGATGAERFARLTSVDIAAIEKVLATAAPASVLTPVPVAAEGHIRQEALASIAPADGRRCPNGKPQSSGSDRAHGADPPEQAAGGGDVSHPHAH